MVESGREDLRVQGAKAKTGATRSPQPAIPVEAARAPSRAISFAGIPFLTHLKWLVVGWVAVQVLASFVPWADFLFVPLLLAYVAWIILKVNRNGSGALAERARQLLAHAAEEVRKAQQTQTKKP
ncbi:MAG TPA: hypothetical protein VE934_01735 [Polaromonas sp.]|uniref:hypothetical protein n=1 Tax=Polaromonas sp. TaxID=1869339 RepID=UPI002D46E966|nr:hypothetical protein [Polaromonas sp.]HYW55656.1 hypothetical protein [Polaromonas sp.]